VLFPKCPCCSGNVTIRRLRDSDGTEVWNSSRGVAQIAETSNSGLDLTALHRACRALVYLGDPYYYGDEPRLLSAGHAVQAADEGVIVEWYDDGSSGRVVGYSQSIAPDAYDTRMNSSIETPAHGPRFLAHSGDLLWTAGWVRTGSMSEVPAIQGYDPSTLRGQVFVALPETPPQLPDLPYPPDRVETNYSEVEELYRTTDGVVVVISVAIRVYDHYDAMFGGQYWIVTQVAADGSHQLVTLNYRLTPYSMPGYPARLGSSVITQDIFAGIPAGPDRMAFLTIAERDEYAYPWITALVLTDHALNVQSITKFNANEYGTWINPSGFHTHYIYVDPNDAETTTYWMYREDLSADDTHVYVRMPSWRASTTRDLVAIRIADGGIDAKVHIPARSTDIVPDYAGSVFFGQLGGGLITKVEHGVQQWTSPCPIVPYRVVTANGAHYIASASGYVAKLDATSGDVLWIGKHASGDDPSPFGTMIPVYDLLVHGDAVYLVGAESPYKP